MRSIRLRTAQNIQGGILWVKWVPLVHILVLIVLVTVLLRYTRVYGWLYERSRLIANYCSNVLLFGISDVIAQLVTYLEVQEHDIGSRGVEAEGMGLLQRSLLTEGLEENDISVFDDYGPQIDMEIYGFNREILEQEDLESDNELLVASSFSKFNTRRWVCFMCWGWIMSNFQLLWYEFLTHIYTEDLKVIQVLKMVLTDQLIYSPIVLYFFLMYSNYIIELGDDETFTVKINKIYFSTLGCSYFLWPVVQFINFLVIPKRLQMPFSSTIGIIWNCFLSMRTYTLKD